METEEMKNNDVLDSHLADYTMGHIKYRGMFTVYEQHQTNLDQSVSADHNHMAGMIGGSPTSRSIQNWLRL